IFEKLTKGQEENWKPFFHPKLRVKSDIGQRIFSQLKQSYAKPWQFSIYRVFGIYAPEGDKLEVPCPNDQITITSRYGYPLQWAVWFQVMGQNELGRMFVPIAPRDGKWYVVGWHFQQWTQSGRDYEAWVKAGTEAYNAKDLVRAHISFDVAQKMLFG